MKRAIGHTVQPPTHFVKPPGADEAAEWGIFLHGTSLFECRQIIISRYGMIKKKRRRKESHFQPAPRNQEHDSSLECHIDTFVKYFELYVAYPAGKEPIGSYFQKKLFSTLNRLNKGINSDLFSYFL